MTYALARALRAVTWTELPEATRLRLRQMWGLA